MTNDDWQAAMAELEAENVKLRAALERIEKEDQIRDPNIYSQWPGAVYQPGPYSLIATEALKTVYSPDR